MRGYICDLLNYDLSTLKGLKSSLASRLIIRLDHSLQLESCAERDGADIELIVAALNHDIGDALAPEKSFLGVRSNYSALLPR